MADEDQVEFTFSATGEAEVERAFQSLEAAAAKAARGTERSSKQIEAAFKKSEQAKWREAERTAAKIEKELSKQVRAAERAADQEVRAVERAAQRKLRAEQRAADQVRKHWLSVGEGVARSLQRGVENFVGGAIREAIKLQSLARRIAIGGRRGGDQLADVNGIRRDLERAALATPGVTAQEVGESVASYRHRGGNLEDARRYAGVFATTKSAVGDEASAEQIGKAGAILSKQFDIHTVTEMGDAMAHLVFAAKESGQPLGEMVGRFDRMAAAAKSYKLGEGVAGLNKILALNAMAREGVGERRAMPAVASLLQQLKGNATKIKAATRGKVDPFADKMGNMNPIEQTIAGLFSYTKHTGDKDNFNEIQKSVGKLIGGRNMDVIKPLLDAYKGAYTGTQGTQEQKAAAGTAALTDRFNQLAKQSGDYAELQKDAGSAQQDVSAQATAAMEQLKAQISEAVLPSLGEAAKSLSKIDFAAAIGPAVTVLQALAEQGALAVDVLKAIGLFKTKTDADEDPKERLRRAKEDLDKYEKNREIGPETNAQIAKHEALKAAVATAEGGVWSAPAGMQGKAKMTAEEFATKYASLSGGDADKQDFTRRGAMTMASRLEKNPSDWLAGNDFLQGSFLGMGENRAMRDLRHNYADQFAWQPPGQAPVAAPGGPVAAVSGAGATSGAPGGANEHKEAAGALTRAAGKLDAAADKMGKADRPTIYHGPDGR